MSVGTLQGLPPIELQWKIATCDTRMSEVYREETQLGDDSDNGSADDHIAELETDNFVWADVQEEMGRFEDFSVDMIFTRDDWNSFSQPLRDYIRATRLMHKASKESSSVLILPRDDMDAKPWEDNVTRRSRSYPKVEQTSVESGYEETGSFMQRIASNLMQANDKDRAVNKEEVTTSELPVDDKDRSVDFEDLRNFQELCKTTWRLSIL